MAATISGSNRWRPDTEKARNLALGGQQVTTTTTDCSAGDAQLTADYARSYGRREAIARRG